MVAPRVAAKPLGKASTGKSRLGGFDEAIVVAVLALSVIVPSWYATLAILTAVIVVMLRVRSPGSVKAWLPTLLLALLVLGLIGASLGSFATVDVARDLVGIARLGGLVFLGLLLATEPAFLPRLLRAFVLAGVVGAGHHLYTLATSPALAAGLQELRTEVGKGSLTEVVALALVLLWSGPEARRWIPPQLRLLCGISLTISLLLYFSRTSLMSLLIILIAQTILAARQRREGRSSATKYLLGLILVGAAFFSIAPSTIVDPFADKVENSINEVLPRGAASVSLIKQNYRAYESHRAISAFQEADLMTKTVGYGWGYRVDLLVNTASTTAESARFSAPVLHNGYLFILVKTGVLGLLVYLAILVAFLRGALIAARNASSSLVGQVAVGCCVTTVVSTIVIGGLVNPSTFNGVTIFMAFAVGAASSFLSSDQAVAGA